MAKDKINTFFITELPDIKWLSGYTGTTAYLVITADSAVFATDGRYETQCRQTLDGFWELTIVSDYRAFFKQVGEAHSHITVQPNTPAVLMAYLQDAGATVAVDKESITQQLRIVKDAAELSALQAEYELAGRAFLDSLKDWRYDSTELSWAALLEYNMKSAARKLNSGTAVGPSFETIVASGERGALPHGTASSRIIRRGDAVTIDFGSTSVYNSDYTRVVYDGNNPEILKIIDIVRQAMEQAIEAVRPGAHARDVDAVARSFIAKCGYKDYFNHGLGHGVGMEVHELPHISPRGTSILEEGMVFTIEPGIYIPDKYGIRLEQTVYVNSSSCTLLSNMLDKYVYSLI
jgi:Xaa-Pro aminopeptidase